VTRSNRIAFATSAVVALALFLALARAVGRNPDPAWLLTIETAWVNHSTLVAWWLTWFGYAYVLGPVCLVLLFVAWRYPQWRVRALFSIFMLVLCWQGADFAQHFFARPRRLDWVVKHETAFGFPSSHATIATGFYGLWATFAACSSLRGRVWLSIGLGLLALGICWSRLALAAHYLTDVLGGFLFAIALVGAAAACLPINVFGRPEGRT
jgi:undecaprenyl-diphosphatase